MDYSNQTQLWKKSGNYFDLTKNIIADLALPIKNTDNQLYTMYNKEIQTMIKVTYDESNNRTLIRTETTPYTEPPKKLIKILREQDFKKIV